MTDHHFDKVLRSARTFLNRWNDASGELWELTPHHKSLYILLRHPSREGNLLIACIDPQQVSGPVRWANCNIEVCVQPLSQGKDQGFSVVDRAAGLSVLCGSVEVKENVRID